MNDYIVLQHDILLILLIKTGSKSMTSRKNNSGGKQYSWNSLTGQNKLFKRYVYVQILVSKEEIETFCQNVSGESYKL